MRKAMAGAITLTTLMNEKRGRVAYALCEMARK
jgi:hypothetical protein